MTDRELLARYAATGSAEAFDEIARRHTAMVYSTCLRLLGEAHAAEDACQATFLVLLRKGRRLPAATVLSGWLFRVAEHVARNAGRIRTRRERHEKEMAMIARGRAGETADRWAQVRPRLDAALAALSVEQRDALVLRYLRGLPLAEAAREASCPPATMHTRTMRALERLRRRLGAAGSGLSVAALGGLLGAQAIEVVPSGLVTAVSAAALAGSTVPVAALELAEGTMKAMLWMKVKLVAGVLVVAALVGTGGGLAARHLAAGEPAKPDAPAPEKQLNPALLNLPLNTWVHIKPNRNPEGRSFSGVCWGNGLIFYFGGGHASYVGNDVELYDVAANTWTQATELEDWRECDKWPGLTEEDKKKIKPIGGGCSPAPFVLSPKGRPLVYHTYQQHVWFPEERAFYNINVWQQAGLWAFDPAKREWREITRPTPQFGDQSTLALTYDPGLKTVVAMTTTRGPAAYAFDGEKKSWVKKCGFPKGTGGDIYTAYDPDRKVHVVATKSLWFTLDLAAGTTKPMKSLSDAVKAAGKTPSVPDASMTFDPDAKLTLALANGGGKPQGSPIELWAHDAGKDEWSEVKMDGPVPKGDIRWGLMVHVPDHKCCLLVNVLGVQGSRLQGGPVNGLFAFRLKR